MTALPQPKPGEAWYCKLPAWEGVLYLVSGGHLGLLWYGPDSDFYLDHEVTPVRRLVDPEDAS